MLTNRQNNKIKILNKIFFFFFPPNAWQSRKASPSNQAKQQTGDESASYNERERKQKTAQKRIAENKKKELRLKQTRCGWASLDGHSPVQQANIKKKRKHVEL